MKNTNSLSFLGLLIVKYLDETAQAGKTIAEEFLSLCGMFIIMYIAIFAQMIIHEAGLWFSVPSDEEMKNSMVAARGVFACNRLMDAQQFEEADRLMMHMLAIDSGMVGLHRNLMICNRIYLELIGGDRSEVLESMYNKEQKKFMKAMKISLLLSVLSTYILCSMNRILRKRKV